MSDRSYQSPPSQGAGSFLTGVFFGAVAGACGYFLFGTDEGKKARRRLNEEWEKAKQEMAKSGVIQDSAQSLPDAIQHTIQRIIEPKKHHSQYASQNLEASKTVVDVEPTQKTSSVDKKKSVVKKSSSKKFKGV